MALCADRFAACPHYDANFGYCTDSYVEWMRNNCAETCGYCRMPHGWPPPSQHGYWYIRW